MIYLYYLGHNFIQARPKSELVKCIEYECAICKTYSFFYINDGIHASDDMSISEKVILNDGNNHYFKIILSCEEVQIKKLLE